MKFLILFLLSFSINHHLQSKVFHTRIHEVDISTNQEPHLIKLSNGHVAFLENNFEKGFLHSLKEYEKDKVAITVTLDQNHGLVSLVPKTGGDPLEDEVDKPFSPDDFHLDFIPSIIESDSKLKQIFKRLNRGFRRSSQCYNKAHVWAYEEYKKHNLKSEKAFLFFTNRYIRLFRFPWWFHVAPLFSVNINGRIVKKVMDPKWLWKPVYPHNWTKLFMRNFRNCPLIKKYSDYANHQESQHCYLLYSPMYYWQPKDLEALEKEGKAKTFFFNWEVKHSYEEAFNN